MSRPWLCPRTLPPHSVVFGMRRREYTLMYLSFHTGMVPGNRLPLPSTPCRARYLRTEGPHGPEDSPSSSRSRRRWPLSPTLLYARIPRQRVASTSRRRSGAWQRSGGLGPPGPRHGDQAEARAPRGGIAFVVIGHLGDGTSTREVTSGSASRELRRAGWQVRDEGARRPTARFPARSTHRTGRT